MTVKEYVAVSIVMCIILYGFATFTESRHEQNKQLAINNAIASFEPSPLNCKENAIIESMKHLANNGVHLKSYELRIKVDNEQDSDGN